MDGASFEVQLRALDQDTCMTCPRHVLHRRGSSSSARSRQRRLRRARLECTKARGHTTADDRPRASRSTSSPLPPLPPPPLPTPPSGTLAALDMGLSPAESTFAARLRAAAPAAAADADAMPWFSLGRRGGGTSPSGAVSSHLASVSRFSGDVRWDIVPGCELACAAAACSSPPAARLYCEQRLFTHL